MSRVQSSRRLILEAGFLNWKRGLRTLRSWDPFALRPGLGLWFRLWDLRWTLPGASVMLVREVTPILDLSVLTGDVVTALVWVRESGWPTSTCGGWGRHQQSWLHVSQG